ncbi:MAG: adenosine deaminase [Elusimicrobia bacterium]|nr:adenosine deaminase [Elusimicrobiota bacterium]
MRNDSSAANAKRSLREIPKVELHCHLDGALRPATILELGRAQGVRLPADRLPELIRHVQVTKPCTLTECLKVFDLVLPLLQDADSLARAAYELVEDSAQDNIRHLEVRFAPALHGSRGLSTDDAVAAVLRGLARGHARFGVSTGVIVCLLRGLPESRNAAAFESLRRAYGSGVVGLDLAGDESRFPIDAYAKFFERARELGIPATCHAGESRVQEIRAALDLGVARLGHATRLCDDASLLGEVARRGVAIEVNLTSNVRTGSVPSIESHPARTWFEAGIPLSLNTDDRGLFGIDLTHEYDQALLAGFTREELERLANGAMRQAFLPRGAEARA